MCMALSKRIDFSRLFDQRKRISSDNICSINSQDHRADCISCLPSTDGKVTNQFDSGAHGGLT